MQRGSAIGLDGDTDSLASTLRARGAEVHVIAPEVLDADRVAALAADAVLCLAPIVAPESSVLHAVQLIVASVAEHAEDLFRRANADGYV
jgi:hypothetical protein